MSDANIRKYTQNDYQAVVKYMTNLQNYLSNLDKSQEQKSFLTKQEAEEYANQALLDVEEMDGVVFVAEVNGEIKGFIQGVIIKHEKDVMHRLTHKQHVEGWIGLLFTDPESRGHGVGSGLIKAIHQYFKENGCTSMRLKVASNNDHAIKVYSKYGFGPKDLEMAIRI